LENFTLPRAAGVFCNSDYTQSLVQPRAKKVWRVPNALRREFFEAPRNATPDERCILLNVGAITERKTATGTFGRSRKSFIGEV